MRRRGTLLLATAILAAGCQAAGGTPSTSSVTPVTPQASPPASTPASTAAASNPSEPAASAEGALPFRYTLPTGWQRVSPAALRAQLDAALQSGGATGDIKDVWTWGRDEVDRGHVVDVVAGPSGVPNATASVILMVLDPPASLDAGAAEAIASVPGSFPDPPLEPVQLPIGDALRGQATFSPSGGVPSQAVVYFTLLPDGRLLWLDGAAPAGDAGFEALMDDIAESLARP